MLGTEFPAAQQVLESGKEKVTQAWESKEFADFCAQGKSAMDAAGASFQKEFPAAQRCLDQTRLAVSETLEELFDTVPQRNTEEKEEEDSWCDDDLSISLSSILDDASAVSASSGGSAKEVSFSSMERSHLIGSTISVSNVDVWNA